MTIFMIRVAMLLMIVPSVAGTVLAQSAPPAQTPATDYRIGANDVLTITVQNERALSGDVVVRPDGKIALKIGKEIVALGLRPDELKAKVMEELSKFFKPVPEVSVTVKQINSLAVISSAAATLSPPPMLEVSGPTYRATGEIGGAMVGRSLKLNEPIEVYQVSGKTLCASASATTGKPNDAGSGWRLTIVPLKLGSEVVLNVNWQRLWERGEALANGPKGSAVVTLEAGERILLDYITAGDLAGSSSACNAIGMGLQIGIPPVESREIIESTLWLVRTLADGSERSVRQTVRVRAGTTTEFFFDDEQIVLSVPKAGTAAAAPPVERTVRTSGSLRPIGHLRTGKIIMELVLAQYLTDRPGSTDRVSGGSTTYELSAGPEEVVAFRVPQVSDGAGRVGERLSLRIQVKALNR